MADPLDAYNAELNKRSQSYEDMNPQQFLDLAQGLGIGTDAVSTEFPGLGSDFGGINRYLEGKAEDSYKTIDTSVLEAQALSGNQRAENELANRRENSLISSQIDIPPVDMSGLDIEYQVEKAAAEKKLLEEKALEKSQRVSDTIIDRKIQMDALAGNVSQENIDQAFMAGLDDYIGAARGAGPKAPKVRSLEEYKKLFTEATGVDVSGKVDKKSAMMSFGLALMQNKAGKDFNVSKMLTSVGVAGEKALPALEKAKLQARNDAIAGGKFALESKSDDEAKNAAAREKAMARSDYFIIPKTDNVRGVLATLAEGSGKRKSLSKYEVDKLMKDPEFSSKFEVLPGSLWGSVVTEAMKTKEASEYFLTKTPREMSIIDGDDGFGIKIFDANPNLAKAGTVQAASTDEIEAGYRTLQSKFATNQKNKDKFISLQAAIDDGSVNVFASIGDKFKGTAKALGIKTEGLNADAKMKAILKEIQAGAARDILGEIKGTSDFERQMVKEIVGDKTFFSNPAELAFKVANIYEKFVVTEERKILEGLKRLDSANPSNSKISDYFGDGELSEEEKKSMNADLKAMGVNQ